jgi:hypothetical protein
MHIFSFFIFGFYVGALCGLSQSPITLTLMPLLFTFAGGTVFAFFGKMSVNTRKSATSSLGIFFLAATIGTLSAIYANSYALFGPKRIFLDTRTESYLRGGKISNIESILTLFEQEHLKKPEAIKKIRSELSE